MNAHTNKKTAYVAQAGMIAHAGCRSRSHHRVRHCEPDRARHQRYRRTRLARRGVWQLGDVSRRAVVLEAARPSETRAARAGDRQCAHRARLPSPPSARPWLLHHSVHICCARWAVPAHVPVWRRVHGHRGSARHVRARAALAFGAQTLGGCPASSRITARRCGAGPSIARGSTWR